MVRKIFKKVKVKKNRKKISDPNFENGQHFFVQFLKIDPKFIFKKHDFSFQTIMLYFSKFYKKNCDDKIF